MQMGFKRELIGGIIMKTKKLKSFIGMALSVFMLLGVFSSGGFESIAAGTYDASVSITPPRPGETPGAGSITDSILGYEMLSYYWEDTCCDKIYSSDKSGIIAWMESIDGSLPGDNGNFSEFENGHSYELTIIAKASNFSAPMGSEGVSTIKDASTSEIIGDDDINVIPVSAYKSYLPEGTAFPSCITEKDSMAVIMTGYIECAPEGHEHTTGEKSHDSEYHWNICSECGVVLMDSKVKHSVSYGGIENWRVLKEASEGSEGLWVKSCSGCDYNFDTVTVPRTGEQTIVSSYDELKAALAKGGKQWIRLYDKDSYVKWIIQEDMQINNSLVLDDPNADITIDLNGWGISRETGKYDHELFNIVSGKLRILSRTTSTVTNNYNLNFRSASDDFCLFRVGVKGTLRITNINGFTFTEQYACSKPTIISSGNLTIDGGIYDSFINKFSKGAEGMASSVWINGGKAVINGGDIRGSALALAVTGGNLTVNNGILGSYNTGVYVGSDSKLIVNGGVFERKNSAYNWKQECGVIVDGGSIELNGGSFDAKNQGIKISGGSKAVVNDCYISTDSDDVDSQYGGLVIGETADNVRISGGEFSGKNGIVFYKMLRGSAVKAERMLSDYLTDGCTVTDNGIAVDADTEASSFGSSYLEVKSALPVIISQPEAVSVLATGTITFKAKVKNASEYRWYICEADDEDGQAYSWTTAEQYGVISGVNSDTLTISRASMWFDGKTVYLCASNSSGRAYTNNADITIETRSVPEIIQQPESVLIEPGESAVFMCDAWYADSYSWYFADISWNDIADKGYAVVSGENSPVLKLSGITQELSGLKFYCRVTNSNGYSTTKYARIIVKKRGDVNSDGYFNIADAVSLKKWLSGSGELKAWEAGDYNGDNIIDVFDFVSMKRALLAG